MKRRSRILSAVLLSVLAFGSVAGADAAQEARHESQRELKREAKITMKQARATALAQVPEGKIKSSELERENGRLIYSFDIRAGSGIKEVQIDATTGAVIEVTDESAANEARERQQERQERRQRRP